MPAIIICDACREKMKVSKGFSGKRVKCPSCGSVVSVPREGGAKKDFRDDIVSGVTEDSGNALNEIIANHREKNKSKQRTVRIIVIGFFVLLILFGVIGALMDDNQNNVPQFTELAEEDFILELTPDEKSQYERIKSSDASPEEKDRQVLKIIEEVNRRNGYAKYFQYFEDEE